MTIDNGSETESWAFKLIDALVAQGVDYFCWAPGSRSTPLALAIANHGGARRIVHFDERGLCFHAVGYGKATGRPAVVVATSGTAIGNLMPGVMEASNDRVPLILLTADRPPELRDCGANQTCDQVKLFQNFARWQVDLPCADERISERYLSSTVGHAVAISQYPTPGPVQINCMFREPLFSHGIEHRGLETRVHFEQPVLHPSEGAIAFWEKKLSGVRRGVILAGSSCSDAVFSLAERLKWPIFADIISSLRTDVGPPSLITYCDPLLKLKNSVTVDAVIQFGDRFVSKTLAQWLEKQKLKFFLHVSDHCMRQDPSHLVTHRVQSCPKIFVDRLCLAKQEDESWLAEWHQWDERCDESLSQFFSDQTTLTEPGIVWEIASFLTKEWCLFVGTSMPVRDANQFLLPRSGCAGIYGNRGVSGIDGIIATACGIAKGRNKPMLALIGDLTCLHDLNSLALLAKMDVPVILCVVNNDGGGIFSFLPVSKRKEAFEEFIVAPHGITFGAAASLFGIPYHHPKTHEELREIFSSPQSCIIEITTDRTENVHFHEKIITTLGQCLSTAQSPVEMPAALH